ncbi:MAG: hypothetical protein IKF31_06615 [Clostridiales bacterium]|nr:hypothetical protein [Clostridiales bacterium]
MRERSNLHSKKGMGTVEIVIIIAVLVSLALIFRAGITEYGQKVMSFCFDDSKIASAF